MKIKEWQVPFIELWEKKIKADAQAGLLPIISDQQRREGLLPIELWQSLGIWLATGPFIALALREAERRGITPDGLLVTVSAGSPPVGHIAFNEEIQIPVRLRDGAVTRLDYRELKARYAEVVEVAPGDANLVTILRLPPLISAWDVRSALHAAANHPKFPLKRTLLEVHAPLRNRKTRDAATRIRARRHATFDPLSEAEKTEIICDVLTEDFFDSHPRKRVPLRGLIIRGQPPLLDSGEEVNPFRLYTAFDGILRDRYRDDDPAEAPVAASTDPENIEDLIAEATSSLPSGPRKTAMQHRIRAKLFGMPLKEYCQKGGFSYAAVQKAAKRGEQHLRKHLLSKRQ